MRTLLLVCSHRTIRFLKINRLLECFGSRLSTHDIGPTWCTRNEIAGVETWAVFVCLGSDSMWVGSKSAFSIGVIFR